MHLWVQIPATHAKEFEDDGELMKGNGYRYKNSQTGENMVEYHINTISEKLLKEFIHNQLGGNLSIQFPEGQCPLIIFGHFECFFKQFGRANLVLWELGFIDTLNQSQYTISGKQDGFGILRLDTSPKVLDV